MNFIVAPVWVGTVLPATIALFIAAISSVVHAGPIESLLPGQWAQIANSKIRSVVMSPNPPGVDAVEGPGAVVWSWNGGAYDSKRDRLLVWGGGHNAYAGNEIYAFDLNALSWTRVTDPSSIVGHTGGATYPDGRPTAVHSYDQIEFDPVADRMFVFGGSRFPSGSQTDTAFTFNFDTKAWTQVANIAGDPYSELNGLSLNSAYDPVTGLIYIGGAWALGTYNVTTNVWATLSRNYGGWELFNGTTAALDHKRRKFVQIGRGYAWIWDIAQAAPPRSTLVTTGAKEIEQCDAPGLDYDPVSDRIVGWCKTADVYTLNLDTKVWTKVTASGTVTPGDPYLENPVNYHGTFGRFRYVPSKNVFVVVTDIDKDVFVYKLTSGSGQKASTVVALGASAEAVKSSEPVTLWWDAFNADLCTASGAWSGSKAFSGLETTNALTSDSSFSLSCSSGDSEPVLKSVSVTVDRNGGATASASTGSGAGSFDAMTLGMVISASVFSCFRGARSQRRCL